MFFLNIFNDVLFINLFLIVNMIFYLLVFFYYLLEIIGVFMGYFNPLFLFIYILNYIHVRNLLIPLF
jgi:hypothetical protein